MSFKIPTLYPTAAIMIHSCGEEITKEKMEDIFRVAKVPFLPKLAEYFVRSKEQMDSYLSFVGSAPSQAAVEDTKDVQKEVAEVAAPVEEEDVDLDMDDLFD